MKRTFLTALGLSFGLMASTALAGDVRIMWYSDGVEGEVIQDLLNRFMAAKVALASGAGLSSSPGCGGIVSMLRCTARHPGGASAASAAVTTPPQSPPCASQSR